MKVDKDFDIDLSLFGNKLEEAYEQKERHLSEIIERMERFQIKFQATLEEEKKTGNNNKILYLTGVVDGINSMVEPLKKYRDS